MHLSLWPQQFVRLSWHALQEILPSYWTDGVDDRKHVLEAIVELMGPGLGALIRDGIQYRAVCALSFRIIVFLSCRTTGQFHRSSKSSQLS